MKRVGSLANRPGGQSPPWVLPRLRRGPGCRPRLARSAKPSRMIDVQCSGSLNTSTSLHPHLCRRIRRPRAEERSDEGEARAGRRKTKKNAPGSFEPGAFRTFFLDYLITLVTVPAPTVRPPSRIANLEPSSIAIGETSSTIIWMLSPGIHISTPAGRFRVPVTSVVRK